MPAFFRIATLGLLGVVFVPTAHADWLAVHPTCAMGDAPRRSGPSELLYPRPGLPAFAEPGDALTMRVRVPTALTPPPGVQQERALAGWYVELVGTDTLSVAEARHHYRLRVADVRPDGHSTLVYRATVQLPPWLAPGTYDMKVRSPGSEEVFAPSSLRVGTGGARIARLASRPTAEEAAALARLPVDVWLLDSREWHAESDSDSDSDSDVDSDSRTPSSDAESRTPSADADDRTPNADGRTPNADSDDRTPTADPAPLALPWLDLAGTFGVRVGDGLLVSNGCDDPHVPFRVAIERVGAPTLDVPDRPAAGRYRDAEGHEAPIPNAGLVPSGDERWVNRAGVPLLVRVVFPEGPRGLALEGASERIGFWPGTPVRPVGHRASVVGLWTVPAGAWVSPRRLEPDEPTLEVTVRGEPTTHATTPVQVRSDGRVALAWEEDGSAFVDEAGIREVPVRFRWLEHHELHALAIGPRGAARRTASATVVVTERPNSCSAGPGTPPFGAIFCTTLGLFWLRRRRFLCQHGPTR